MGKQFLIASAVRPFLAIEAIGRTEIRDAALRRHTRSAEKDDIVAALNQFPQSVDLLFQSHVYSPLSADVF